MSRSRLRQVDRQIWRAGLLVVTLLAGAVECAALWRARRQAPGRVGA